MITVSSFLRSPDGEFVPVEAATAAPPDPDYIEGAIELQIDGTEIIGKPEWDYVDQLWAYLADLVRSLADEPAAETYFPDQPILLRFRRTGSRVLVSAQIGETKRTADADYAEFLAALRAAGTTFFARMAELVPSAASGYRTASARISG